MTNIAGDDKETLAAFLRAARLARSTGHNIMADADAQMDREAPEDCDDQDGVELVLRVDDQYSLGENLVRDAEAGEDRVWARAAAAGVAVDDILALD